MKKVLVFLSFALVFISCGGKEVKKEKNVPEKKVETVAVPVIKKVTPRSILVFTVQIGANKKESTMFSSIENVQVSNEKGMYKYRLGVFETYKEAKSYRKAILKKFPGAFVQAVKNGIGIEIKEALK